MPKYYRVVEDLEVGDALELNAEGKVQLHKEGELLGVARKDAKAGKKLAAADIQQPSLPVAEEIARAVEKELWADHDHDHDGEPDHAAEDCDHKEAEIEEVNVDVPWWRR